MESLGQCCVLSESRENLSHAVMIAREPSEGQKISESNFSKETARTLERPVTKRNPVFRTKEKRRGLLHACK